MTCPRPPAFCCIFPRASLQCGLPETASNTHNTARDSPFDTTHLGVDGNCTFETLAIQIDSHARAHCRQGPVEIRSCPFAMTWRTNCCQMAQSAAYIGIDFR